MVQKINSGRGDTVRHAEQSRLVILVVAAWVVTRVACAAGSEKPVPESDSAGGLGFTAKVGTLGAGGDVTIGANDYLGMRLGGSGFGWKGSRAVDEGTVHGDLELLAYSALLDVHPFGGGFRISGGGMLNKNKVRLQADLDKSVTLDGRDFTLSDLQGEVTFAKWAPYLGIGYGNAVGADGRWHFACDFGVMYQGSPKVTASATASDPALQPVVDEALDNESANIQDDANAYKYYPVISLGISYRF